MKIQKNRYFDVKKVEFIELFFDLIFVYAISQMSHTILHLEHAIVPGILFFKYGVMLFVFVSIWSYQTIYTNRFGLNNTRDLMFLMFNMFITIYLSNSINTNSDKTYEAFFLCTAILFLSIGLQYLLTFSENILHEEKKLCLVYGLTSIFSSILIFIGYFIPGDTHYNMLYIAIICCLLFPLFGIKILQKSPVNMPHLIERYSLFTIIMFGESMVGLGSLFNIQHFEIISIFQFLIILGLFGSYWIKLESFMNPKQKSTGLKLCYTHIIIFFALGLINASEIFSEEVKINPTFEITLTFVAISLFYLGMLLNMTYFHQVYKTKKLYIYVAIILILFYIINLLIPFHSLTFTILVFLTVSTILGTFMKIRYNNKARDITITE